MRARCSLGLALLVLGCGPESPPPYEWDLPPGFPVPRVPEDNPMSEAKVELGRFLFYDTRLSGNQTQSCASCHQQALGFTDGRPNGIGSTGEVHPRSAMGLTNIAYAARLTWANPVLDLLEQQAMAPMFGEAPVELGLSGLEAELIARLERDPAYPTMFAPARPSKRPWALSARWAAVGARRRAAKSSAICRPMSPCIPASPAARCSPPTAALPASIHRHCCAASA